MADRKHENPERLRRELLGQLRYLIDEVESLKGVIQRVPVKVQEGRPLEGDLSIKETYGLLASLDEEIHLPLVEGLAQGGEPEVNHSLEEFTAREYWNEQPIQEILTRLQEARNALVTALDELNSDEWQRTGRLNGEEMDAYDLAYFVTQHDVQRLREVGYRLHESTMSSPLG